jgi:hypothetical protein
MIINKHIEIHCARYCTECEKTCEGIALKGSIPGIELVREYPDIRENDFLERFKIIICRNIIYRGTGT